MNGYTVFRQAMRLLNYTDADGSLNAASSGELYKRALTVVDRLCGELYRAEGGKGYTPLSSLSDPLPLSEKAAAALPYGVAALLAAGRADGDNQQLFGGLYDAARRSVAPAERRVDVLPWGCDQ